MAETAPLTSAHTHARQAAERLSHSSRKESSEEHQNAASDFSRAARNTSDSEALRVLKLLEEQHHRLARILQKNDSPPASTAEESTAVQGQASTTAQDVASPKAAPSEINASARTKPSSIKTANRVGSQTRESSPSLARDIATRRGIPPPGRGTASATSQGRSKASSPESKRRQSTRSGAGLKIPPSIVESQASIREAQRAKKAEDDEGFSKFYNSLTTGTMSKLSSALAYAGLPLTADDIKTDQTSQKRTVSASNDPDVKKYISKAALDAVEYQHRQRGTFGHGFGPAESFYVVQTGGGTYSYADIAKNRQGHLAGIEEDDDDAFVDARELPGPSSPRHSRTSHRRRDPFGKGRSQEELELENTTLKSTIDYMTKRLSNFEAHAQDASMAALNQSMISLRGPADGGDAAMQDRLKQLERQIEQQAEERQQLEERSAKQNRMLKKYQAKFEELKSSAKEKDKAKRERAEKGGAGEDASVGVPDIS